MSMSQISAATLKVYPVEELAPSVELVLLFGSNYTVLSSAPGKMDGWLPKDRAGPLRFVAVLGEGKINNIIGG